MGDVFYRDLPEGTCLRDGQGNFIRVISMQGDLAHCEKIKRDETRDLLTRGWSGSLAIEKWRLAMIGGAP